MRLFLPRRNFRAIARRALLALALALALGLPAAALGARAAAAAEKGDTELARLRDFLIGPDRTLTTRRDAADVLIDKDTTAARAILVEVLTGPTPSETILATLDAVAARDSAHEVLIEPLFKLLRSEDEPTRRAAAAAFGAYQGHEKVLQGLNDLVVAPATPVIARLAAIQSLAQIVDKRSIDLLVRLTADAEPAVSSAAAAALADMTGIEDLAASGRTWADWWKEHRDAPESRLLGKLLRQSRKDLKRREAVLARVETRLIRQLTETYDAATDAKEKGRLALTHLEDPVAQVRALAARQAAAMARGALTAGNGGGRKAYQELVAALLKHVSDESPAVRAAAAEAVAAWQETTAGPILLAKFNAEKVPEARAAMAAALGSLKVVEVVPKLVAMLDSISEIEVLRAAGALGAIGEKGGDHVAAVKPALKPLSTLARTAVQPTVREAACLALARIATPEAEDVLAAALEDPTANVRFSAAQGLGNLGKAGDKSVAALTSRLQDDNKGVRQAVAAALAKLGGAEAAEKMADRLKPGAEAEPAVRNALWEAIKALADRHGSTDLAESLGDRFLKRTGAEEVQRAAALYEMALTKVPATARNGPHAIVLYEKLVDAYVAAGTPDNAVPTLRQLLIITPPENKGRLRELNQQLGLILLAKDPYAEGIPPLVAAMDEAPDAAREAVVKAIQARAETLMKAKRPDHVSELLGALVRARPDWGATETTAALKALKDQADVATVADAVAKLAGPEEQATTAAATLKRVGKPAVAALLDVLESAARSKETDLEARALTVLESASGRKDHGYDPKKPLNDRLKAIAAWRKAP